MRAIWMRARRELSTGWRSVVALVLILGVAGSVVLFAVAGARRTDTAYRRMIAWSNAPDDLVSAGGFGYSQVDLSKAAKLPEVASSALVHQVGFYPATPSGSLVPVGDGAGAAVANTRDLAVLGRSKLLEGRHADPSRPDEVEVGYASQSFTPVTPGTKLIFHFWKPGVNFLQYYHGEGPEPFDRIPASAFAFSLPVTVTGITATPTDLTEAPYGDVMFTPAFWRAYGARTFASPTLAVHLRQGQADQRAFQRDVTALSEGGNPQLSTITQAYPEVERFLHPQALALWLFGALAALAAALVFGQALARKTFLESNENPTLRSLGMTPRQLFGVGMVRAAVVGASGGAIAVVLAVVLSPLMPYGKSKIAEPHNGLSADWTTLALGFLLVLVGALLLGTIPALRAARARSNVLGVADAGSRARPSTAGAAAARAGLPPTVVTGVRMALEPGRGRTATPVRAALIAAMFAIAALTAAFGFAAGFQHLFDTPRIAGWNWDLAAGIPFTGDLRDKVVPPLLADHAVGGLSEANDSAQVDLRSENGSHTTTGVLAVQSLRGSVLPTVVSGRWPRSADEIALGESTMRALHSRLGDQVEFSDGQRRTAMRIVGTAAFINATGTSTSPGDGAGVTLDGLRRVTSHVPVNIFFIDARPGLALGQAKASIGPILNRAGISFLSPATAESIGDIQPVRKLPLALAGLLALAAAATLGHSLLTSIRRRRRDLAILKTLGFDRGQVRRTVAWQATTMSAVALVFGVLIGFAAGRWVWTLYANQLGVKPEPSVWLGAILLTLLATIVIANALAAIPGRIAARTQAAVVLRAE
jgi:putative ABC transport system permease protein